MEVEIRHSPSAAVARLTLAPGEHASVESGAMYAHSFGVEIDSSVQGGLLQGMKRSLLSGDSLFVSRYINRHNVPVWVDVVNDLPGDLFALHLDGKTPIILTQGSWVANSSGITIDTKWGGASMFFNGGSGFTARCTGQGEVVLASFGAIDVHSLAPGEGLTVDTGHLIAYEESVSVNTRKAATGIMNTLKSGEGLVMDIQGPGDVITQTRNSQSLMAFIIKKLPNRG